MDHWQYLIVLGACLAVTAPLEMFGTGVYRQPKRAVVAILPVAVVFVVWDLLAIAADVWAYEPAFITGVRLPGGIPIEELAFFVVIPLCALLTYSAVGAGIARLRSARPARAEPV